MMQNGVLLRQKSQGNLPHKQAPVRMRSLGSSLAWLPYRVHPQVHLAWPGAAHVVDHQVLHLDLR